MLTPITGMQAGGLPPLLELMASRNGNLQHNAAFALYGLADNEDNIAAIVRQGGVQCLQDCELLVQVRKCLCFPGKPSCKQCLLCSPSILFSSAEHQSCAEPCSKSRIAEEARWESLLECSCCMTALAV